MLYKIGESWTCWDNSVGAYHLAEPFRVLFYLKQTCDMMRCMNRDHELNTISIMHYVWHVLNELLALSLKQYRYEEHTQISRHSTESIYICL